MFDRHLKIIQAALEPLLASNEQILVAIDGNCTAGKTTLANELAKIYDCNVFHMDDFFLRPEQRTPTRYAEPGGNIDYERFQEEVLLPLQREKSFSYRPFHCKDFTLGDPICVTPKKLNIIEGTYSQHPYFGNPYDLTIFLQADPETQYHRIIHRPVHLHAAFFDKWIPMEQAYFETFDIPHKAHI